MKENMLRLLPQDFVPSEKDVICGRGKQFQHHIGNRRFKSIIEEKIDQYLAAHTRPEKTMVVISIVSSIRRESPNGGFVDRDAASGRWYEIGDLLAREKVGHAIRFYLKSAGITTKKNTTDTIKKETRSVKSRTAEGTEETKEDEEETRATAPHAQGDNMNNKTAKLISFMEAATAIATPTKAAEQISQTQRKDDDNKQSTVMEAASALAGLCSQPTPPAAPSTVVAARGGVVPPVLQQKRHVQPPKSKPPIVRKSQHKKNVLLANKLLVKLETAVGRSQASQSNIQKWDREVMGLNASHSQTMRDSARSRKKLLKLSRSEKRKVSQKKKSDLLRCCGIVNNQMPVPATAAMAAFKGFVPSRLLPGGQQSKHVGPGCNRSLTKPPTSTILQPNFMTSTAQASGATPPRLPTMNITKSSGMPPFIQPPQGRGGGFVNIVSKPRTPESLGFEGRGNGSVCWPRQPLEQRKRKGQIPNILSNNQQEERRKRLCTNAERANVVVVDDDSSEEEEAIKEDAQKQIDRLKKEKEALVSALVESKAKQQEEQHKRMVLDRLLQEKAALGSALAKTDAALMQCGGGEPTGMPPPSLPKMNLSRALLVSRGREVPVGDRNRWVLPSFVKLGARPPTA